MQVTVNNILEALGKDFKWKDRDVLGMNVKEGFSTHFPVSSMFIHKSTQVFLQWGNAGLCLYGISRLVLQSLTFQLHIFKCRVSILTE